MGLDAVDDKEMTKSSQRRPSTGQRMWAQVGASRRTGQSAAVPWPHHILLVGIHNAKSYIKSTGFVPTTPPVASPQGLPSSPSSNLASIAVNVDHFASWDFMLFDFNVHLTINYFLADSHPAA
ncbi:hypothetical protein AYO20_06304 [Fonsecaea nubica]|uniref:Uncharacterized protein n=1 Tax=Fonsecaea nubica TaxID=856822 RepID=A0A178CZS1_9EURO|nr:hypothetical protein AYO20_06304 [Fonsecaea nubica]OAL34461.1 hypothetical protein AYO20_06304 [Fonsecaea nubica]